MNTSLCLLNRTELSPLNQIKTIVANALRHRVSDIHLEPTTEGLKIRYRIDGILQDVSTIAPEISRKVVVAIKVKANMDIAESRRPQDGRIDEGAVNMRVSTLPTPAGEKVVIRLLPRKNSFTNLSDLGFSGAALSMYNSWLQQPQGMIILTGPTGSGKTSTLYTSLQTIATESVNVVTVEDPIEYSLPSITQTQLNHRAGVTFATGLRAILRQDPDIIMVGEIRDSETSQIAVQASLTGHLVLTTLHTNDAISAIPRLKALEADSSILSDAILGVVAQRLVRRVCPHCAETYQPKAKDLQALDLDCELAKLTSWRRGRGCSKCLNTGYLGREAIVELLEIDNTMQQIIAEDAIPQMRYHLGSSNFISFRESAIEKVMTGVTTVEEVLRVMPRRALVRKSLSLVETGYKREMSVV
jgi:general secretion pathway protein E